MCDDRKLCYVEESHILRLKHNTHINSKVEILFKAAYQKSRSNYEFFSVISLLQVTVFEGLQRSDL